MVTVTGDKYCLGVGYSNKCEACQNLKNWFLLNDMPDTWRKKQQSQMTNVDSTMCALNGRPEFIPLVQQKTVST